jgi:putative nucleotidyltransferase with HDIG domain
MKSRDDAWELVLEFVQDKGLRRHLLAVAVAMRSYAQRLGQDSDYWEMIGLVHDFDWEIHPDLNRHPTAGAVILRERGWDEEIIRTILSHYTAGTGVERSRPVDYALLACDEITGLIIATTLVRPSKKITDVKLRSIRKKWKDRRFAAGVDRDHVDQATQEFSEACFENRLDMWDHIGNVLAAMQEDAVVLELDGSLAQ